MQLKYWKLLDKLVLIDAYIAFALLMSYVVLIGLLKLPTFIFVSIAILTAIVTAGINIFYFKKCRKE